VDREIFDLTADGLYEVAVSNLPEDEVKRKKVELVRNTRTSQNSLKNTTIFTIICCLAYARTC